MHQWVRDQAQAVLAGLSVHVGHLTPSREILALYERLWPCTSGHPLVRLGPSADGGYLVPDDFEGIRACFSPGVADECGFEQDCADKGLRVYMADASVDAPPRDHELFFFEKTFIGSSNTVPYRRLDDWVASTQEAEGGDLLLQMDIEGAEFEVLHSMSDRLLGRFRIVVLELHWLNQLWNEPFFRIAAPALRRLVESHACVHLHPNNRVPAVTRSGVTTHPLLEATFLRRDRIQGSEYVTEFPHSLDSDNFNRESITLSPALHAPSR